MLTETAVKSSPLAEKIAAQNELIDQLKQQIREQTEKKKELARQQRQIEKLVEAAARISANCNAETIDYIWERLEAVLPKRKLKSIDELEKSSEWTNRIGIQVRNKIYQSSGTLKSIYLEESIAIVQLEENVIAQWSISELELDAEDPTPEKEEEEIEEEELIKNPAKKNTSNSFFVWQPTSNPAVSTYFNIKSGKTQAAYFGASNKRRLAEMETKLMRWFPGVSCCVRMAQRLTEFKYELKVVGWERVPSFDDTDFGWLAGMYDPLQPLGANIKDYLCCLLSDKPEPDELEF